MNHSEIVSFLWGVADLIRDTFKRGKYQDVILPLTVLRRLDCVLARTKDKVLAKQAELRDKKLENLDPQLRRVAGFAFYNTSRYDFEKLLADAPHLAANLRNYIAGFSPNMREVLEKFDFDNTISKLDEAGLLFQVLERFKNDLRYFFIVSAVEVKKGAGNGDAPVVVQVSKAPGLKCERCWNFSTHVGEDKNHPTVCERCSAVLKEIVEA